MTIQNHNSIYSKILTTEFILNKVLHEFVPHYSKLYTDSRYNVPKDVYNFFKLRLQGLNHQRNNRLFGLLLYPKSCEVIGFNEYTFSQIETIMNDYMKVEYIQSDMLSYNIEQNYKNEYGYQKYWNKLVSHLKEFIKILYI